MAKILQWVNYNGTSYELDGVAYAVCSTASSTSAKIVDSENNLNFKLINGAKIVVKFINAITVGTPTLKVGNTAAKYIKYNGSLLQSDTISNNQVCEFVYDSTDDAWLLVGGTGTGSSSTSGDGVGLIGRIITPSDIPTIHEAGWLYIVNAAGTYVGQNCEVGDLILCINSGTTENNDDWVVIQKNVDVALWKGSNTFSDGQLLIADGANGKVRAVAMSPTINFTAGTNLNTPKFKINIGGVDSNEVSINAASTSNMGAVLLNDIPNGLDSSTAATPKLVDTAIINKINTLDVSDTADSTKYVSAISEADGKISVSRESFNPTVTIASGTAANAPAINISVAGNSATAQSLNLATTSNIGVTLLDSALSVNEKIKETTAVTPKGVWTAIGTLDGNITGTPSASKTATSFAESDGIVTATFGDIAINASQVTSGTLPVERGGTGQTSIANIQAGKDENGNSIITTYATKTELNNLIGATDAMVFKGIVNMPEHLPSTNYQRGWTYKVAIAGTYVNQACEVGDIIICINDYDSTVASINDWAVIQTNVDSSLFKGANTFVDGQMLLADGANGKVKAVNINPTLTVGASTNSDTNTIKFSVGGIESSAITLSAASTSNFGETILTNTLSDVEESKAATPKLVSSAIVSSINNLDFTDTADSTKFVSAVNETDGIISVTRELFNPLVSINSGANSNSTPTVTISVAGNSATSAGMPAASTTSYGVTKLSNTPNSLEESLAATPKLVETAVANTINNLDFTDTADPSKYVSAINQSNGIISVSRESLNPQISVSSGATQNDTPTITISIGDDTVSANRATSNGLPAASASSYGVTKLSDATNSQDSTIAASSKAVADKIKRLPIQYAEDVHTYNGFTGEFYWIWDGVSPNWMTEDQFLNIINASISNNTLLFLESDEPIMYCGYSYQDNMDTYSFIGVRGGSEYTTIWPYKFQVSGNGSMNAVLQAIDNVTVPYARTITNTLPVSKGGTGQSSVNARGVLYGSLDGSTIQSTSAGTLGQVLVNDGTLDSNAVPTWKTVGKTTLNTGYTITSPVKMTASIENGVLLFTSSSVGITSSGTVDVVTGFNGVVSSAVPNGNEVSY